MKLLVAGHGSTDGVVGEARAVVLVDHSSQHHILCSLLIFLVFMHVLLCTVSITGSAGPTSSSCCQCAVLHPQLVSDTRIGFEGSLDIRQQGHLQHSNQQLCSDAVATQGKMGGSCTRFYICWLLRLFFWCCPSPWQCCQPPARRTHEHDPPASAQCQLSVCFISKWWRCGSRIVSVQRRLTVWWVA